MQINLIKNLLLLCGVPYAVGVNNGTSALHCAIAALGELVPGDEVIVPANTYIATAWGVSLYRSDPGICRLYSRYLGDRSRIK